MLPWISGMLTSVSWKKKKMIRKTQQWWCSVLLINVKIKGGGGVCLISVAFNILCKHEHVQMLGSTSAANANANTVIGSK